MADKQASYARRPSTPSGPSRPVTPRVTTRPSARPGLAEIISEQERIFISRQPESALLAARATEALAGGVTSSWQIARPQPVWLSHGSGSKLYGPVTRWPSPGSYHAASSCRSGGSGTRAPSRRWMPST